MFLLVCALMCVALTGLALHEWLGFGLCALVLFHVISRWRWFSEQFQRMLMPGAHRVWVNALLNTTLLVMMTALLVSGIFISSQVFPLVGAHFGRAQVWKEIHNWSSVVVIALVSLHLGLNWDWIVSAIRRNASNRPVLADITAPLPRWPANLRSWLAGCVAIASIAGLGVFATYLATAATMRPQPMHTNVQNVQDQHDTANFSGEDARRTTAQRERPQTLRGIKLFGITLFGVLAMAIIARYAFRLRL
jgi:hypothetical protein